MDGCWGWDGGMPFKGGFMKGGPPAGKGFPQGKGFGKGEQMWGPPGKGGPPFGKGGWDSWGDWGPPMKGKGDSMWGPGKDGPPPGKGDWGKACAKGGNDGGPYGKDGGKDAFKDAGKDSKGKGKKGFSGDKGVKGLIDTLINEGLPGGWFEHDKNALYVTNLPHDTTSLDLYQIFACFGSIPPRGIRVMPGQPGQRLYGFVNYTDQSSAEFAMMAMNGVTQPDGAKLMVKLKNSKKGMPGMDAPSGPPVKPAIVSDEMWERLKLKAQEGISSSYEASQWYIITFLGHVTDEEEMKTWCDQLIEGCSALGLSSVVP